MIQIVKKIDLGFLGDRYKDSYMNMRSISMREREELISQLDKLKDERKSFDFVKDTVIERFVDGELKDGDKTEPLTKDDLMDLPTEVFLSTIQQLQGNTSPNS